MQDILTINSVLTDETRCNIIKHQETLLRDYSIYSVTITKVFFSESCLAGYFLS